MDIVRYKKLLKSEILRLKKKQNNPKSTAKRIKTYSKMVKLISLLQKQHNEKMLQDICSIIDNNSVFARDENDKSIFVFDMPVGVEMRVNKMYKQCNQAQPEPDPVELQI